MPADQLEAQAIEGATPFDPYEASAAAIEITRNVIGQLPSEEAGKCQWQFDRLKDTVTTKRFVGMVGLLTSQFNCRPVDRENVVFDASDPAHFPLAVETIIRFAAGHNITESQVCEDASRATSLAQIAANHAYPHDISL